MMSKLAEIVPDLTEQYTTHRIEKPHVLYTVRALHAFQISLVQKGLNLLKIDKDAQITIVDIGDSAGTHIQYLQKLNDNIRSLSVNLDGEAVEKIKSKGLEAIKARAEELHKYNINPEIFMSFETFEHLHSPLQLLKPLADVNCKSLIITVPYVKNSRVALNYIRQSQTEKVFADSVHVFEFSPDDWRPLFNFAGWRVIHDDIYFQYPKGHPLYITKPIWKKLDFEGFYGAILVPDKQWRELYCD